MSGGGRRARPDAPDAGTLAWVERELGGDPVTGGRRLTGGIATATHLLRLRSGRQVVLRRHHAHWIEREPWLVREEAATLAHVTGRGFPTPALLAADPDGSATGSRPALVLERLPGRIELAPSDPAAWLQQVAEALASIHDQPPVPATGATPEERGGVPWSDFTQPPPPWSTHPEQWTAAMAIAADWPTPVWPPTLVHGDFQHFNLLWSRGRLTGIVDWGPPPPRPLDSDLGHCRLNLVILYGTDVADDFLARYTALTGRTVDPWHDLFETVIFLPTWAPTILRQVGARIPVDTDDIHRRVDAHLPTLLHRLS
jgi:aminoglycoside phosphotransferase (APT) family kinase protein